MIFRFDSGWISFIFVRSDAQFSGFPRENSLPDINKL